MPKYLLTVTEIGVTRQGFVVVDAAGPDEAAEEWWSTEADPEWGCLTSLRRRLKSRKSLSNFVPRVYIAGPMTGIEDHNYPAFMEAAREMRSLGWEVVNPAENHGGRTDLPREEYFRTDIPQLVGCDAILMLRGWEESEGAKLEFAIARACGIRALGYTQTPGEGLLADDFTHPEHTIRLSWPRDEDTRRWEKWPREEREQASAAAFDNLIGDIAIASGRQAWLAGHCDDAPPNTLEAAGPFAGVLLEAKALHDKKKADYTGGQADHLANYRFSAGLVGLSPRMGMLQRMGEKLYRLSQLGDGEPENESIRDSYLDIAIIAVLSILNLDDVPGYGN